MIQARPTTYRGVRMRSRLEATFAEQIDRSDYDIRWTYERGDIAGARERMPIIRESIPNAELIIVVGQEWPVRFERCWSNGFAEDSQMEAILRNATFPLDVSPYWAQPVVLW